MGQAVGATSPARARRRRSLGRAVETALTRLLLAILLLFALFPIYWMVSMSVKTQIDALAIPPVWIVWPTAANYQAIFYKGEFIHYFTNSIVVALFTIAVGLVLGIPAAYVLARFKFTGKRNLGFFILTTRMGPAVIMLIPFYMMFRTIDFIDTIQALVIMYVISTLAFIIWVLRGFFLDVPRELEEAGLVDGCGRLGVLLRISLPLIAPGVAATAILNFIFSWNELLFALILTQSAAKTAPAGIYSFISFEEVAWGELTAAGTVVILPVMVFSLLVQGYLVRGLTLGALKG